MGGGKALFEANQQYEKTSKELDEVKFYVHFSDRGNLAQFDLDKLYESVCSEVSDFLDKNCMRSLNVGPVESGGGGVETLWEIIRTLWENKDIIAFFISLLGTFKSIYKYFLTNKIQNLRPRIDVHFWIEADSKVDKLPRQDVGYVISSRLANVLLVMEGLIKSLNEKYRAIYFDSSVEAKVNSLNYSLTLKTPQEHLNERNTARFLKIISDLKLKKGLLHEYCLTKWNLIRRTDSKFNDQLEMEYSKVYYLIISSRVLRDFFD